jgi:colanic acid/amylovoran biosynthesis glycosyltransferase
MKIAFIVNSFPTLAETFILNQITGLIDLGHQVDIFCHTPSRDEKIHPDVEKYNLLSRTFVLPMIPENKIIRALKAFGLLLKNIHKNPACLLSSLNLFKHGTVALSLNLFYTVLPFSGRKYDIIQCHYGPNGVLGAFVKKAGIGRKLATMFHGYDLRRGIAGWGRYAGQLIRHGDCFLCSTRYAQALLAETGVDPDKIVRHTIGIDLNRFVNLEKPKEGNVLGAITILTVARLVKEKSIDFGIKAVTEITKRYPELSLKYIIIGDGYLKHQLENLAYELHVENTVCFMGGMSQEEVIKQMRNADLFLLPSQTETLGTVLLEAQAMKIPVIATTVGGVAEAVQNGVSGFLVAAKDVDALTYCISALIEQREKWNQFGRSGRRHIEQNYDINRLNTRLVEIYQGLLEDV